MNPIRRQKLTPFPKSNRKISVLGKTSQNINFSVIKFAVFILFLLCLFKECISTVTVSLKLVLLYTKRLMSLMFLWNFINTVSVIPPSWKYELSTTN